VPYSGQTSDTAAVGIAPGSAATVDRLQYPWPKATARQSDNILAPGQTILVKGADVNSGPSVHIFTLTTR
jgi:hypothetical protein